MIEQSIINDVLGGTDIVDLISKSGVKLRKSGANFVGACCFHDDHSPSMSVVVDRQFYYCHACGATGNAIGFLIKRYGLSFPQAVEQLAGTVRLDSLDSVTPNVPPRAQRSEAAFPRLATDYQTFFDGLPPVAGTAGAEYLDARGCAVPPDDGDLRFASELRHPSGHIGPALVALVTHAVTKEPMTLHRTWIGPNGAKADVEKPRLLLGRHQKRCGVIRLWPDEAVTQGLAVAEGIETALTAAQVTTPVWSAIDAGNLAAFPPLPGIGSLLIIADNDEAGRRGANECATNWYAAGAEVRIAMSPNPGQDLNDFARAA